MCWRTAYMLGRLQTFAIMFRYFARTYMAFRECFVPTQRLEAQTEILADLHGCIENLNARVIELETRIERCKRQAIYHIQLSKREVNTTGRTRETQRARLCMEERRRVQIEHDKALRMAHMLQMQIDSIVSTNVDNLIVDTMRAYNLNASRLAMPARADQISRLGDELSDRQNELTALQDAMHGVTMHLDPDGLVDDQLMQELEGLLQTEPLPTVKEEAEEAEDKCLKKMETSAAEPVAEEPTSSSSATALPC